MNSIFLKQLIVTGHFILASQLTWAAQNVTQREAPQRGPGSSGGGNAIVCFNRAEPVELTRKNGGYIPNSVLNQIVFIETLDLYQAKKPRGFVEGPQPSKNIIIPISDKETIHQYADRIFKRVQFFFPAFYKELSDELVKTDGQNVIQMDDRIEPVFDIKSEKEVQQQSLQANARVIVLDTGRPNCVVATIARQTQFGEITKFEVDSRLFKHPQKSRLSRAAILIHEVAYSVARRLLKHTNSEAVTFFTGALLTQNLSIADFYAAFNSLFSEFANEPRSENRRRLRSMEHSFFVRALSEAFNSNFIVGSEDSPEMVGISFTQNQKTEFPMLARCEVESNFLRRNKLDLAKFSEVERYIKNRNSLLGLQKALSIVEISWNQILMSARYTSINKVLCVQGIYPLAIFEWVEDHTSLLVSTYGTFTEIAKTVGKQATLPVY